MAAKTKRKGRDPASFERRKRIRFLGRIADILELGEAEVEALLARERPSSVRINRLTARPAEAILSDLEGLGVALEPIPWCADAYRLLSPKQEVSESELFQSGEVYLQNASSLVPPLVLDPRPGDAVLDVCAAPGGKAAHIAALADNRLELWINDAIKPRLEKTRQMLGLLGVKYAQASDHPGQYIDKMIDRSFARILLDAQCSGEGMVDLRHPRALRFWSPSRIEKHSRLQKKMLVASFQLLEAGGALVYATCTFAPEENEEPVDRLLRIFPQADVVAIELDLPAAAVRPGLERWQGKRYDPRLRHALRIVPGGDFAAFFVCKIVRLR